LGGLNHLTDKDGGGRGLQRNGKGASNGRGKASTALLEKGCSSSYYGDETLEQGLDKGERKKTAGQGGKGGSYLSLEHIRKFCFRQVVKGPRSKKKNKKMRQD